MGPSRNLRLVIALCAIPALGCERLFGVDFSVVPTEEARPSGPEPDAGSAGAPAVVWRFRGGPKLDGRSAFLAERPLRVLWRHRRPSYSPGGEPLIDDRGRTFVAFYGAGGSGKIVDVVEDG